MRISIYIFLINLSCAGNGKSFEVELPELVTADHKVISWNKKPNFYQNTVPCCRDAGPFVGFAKGEGTLVLFWRIQQWLHGWVEVGKLARIQQRSG